MCVTISSFHMCISPSFRHNDECFIMLHPSPIEYVCSPLRNPFACVCVCYFYSYRFIVVATFVVDLTIVLYMYINFHRCGKWSKIMMSFPSVVFFFDGLGKSIDIFCYSKWHDDAVTGSSFIDRLIVIKLIYLIAYYVIVSNSVSESSRLIAFYVYDVRGFTLIISVVFLLYLM